MSAENPGFEDALRYPFFSALRGSGEGSFSLHFAGVSADGYWSLFTKDQYPDGDRHQPIR